MKPRYDFTLGRFKFKIIESDYDTMKARSFKYRVTKRRLAEAYDLKESIDHDFDYCEYDCTGSTREQLDVVVDKRFMALFYYWDKDV